MSHNLPFGSDIFGMTGKASSARCENRKPGSEFLNRYSLPENLIFDVERMSLSSSSEPILSHPFFLCSGHLAKDEIFLLVRP